MVGLEEELIDKDFTQSYWLAVQFVRRMKNKPNLIFTEESHRHPTKKMNVNEAQSKLHSIGPKLKTNLVTDIDETKG